MTTTRRHDIPDELEWPTDGIHVDDHDGDIWLLTPSDAFCFEPRHAYDLSDAIQMLALNLGRSQRSDVRDAERPKSQTSRSESATETSSVVDSAERIHNVGRQESATQTESDDVDP